MAAHLADVGRLEHLLAIKRFLRFQNAWQINEFSRVQLLAQVENSSTRVWKGHIVSVVRTIAMSYMQQTVTVATTHL